MSNVWNDGLWVEMLRRRLSKGLKKVAVVKNPPAEAEIQETQVPSLGWGGPLEEEMTTHPSILAWRIPQAEEPGALQSVFSQRVRHS